MSISPSRGPSVNYVQYGNGTALLLRQRPIPRAAIFCFGRIWFPPRPLRLPIGREHCGRECRHRIGRPVNPSPSTAPHPHGGTANPIANREYERGDKARHSRGQLSSLSSVCRASVRPRRQRQLRFRQTHTFTNSASLPISGASNSQGKGSPLSIHHQRPPEFPGTIRDVTAQTKQTQPSLSLPISIFLLVGPGRPETSC